MAPLSCFPRQFPAGRKSISTFRAFRYLARMAPHGWQRSRRFLISVARGTDDVEQMQQAFLKSLLLRNALASKAYVRDSHW